MSKRYESAADRIWKEKLDLFVSFREAAIILTAAGALVAILLIVSFTIG